MAGNADAQVGLMFALGTAAMLMMAVAIILFVSFYQKKMLQEQLKRQELEGEYQKKMLEAELQSRENERSRLSKEIHDGVGVMLQALKATTFAVAKGASDQDRNELASQINDITETVRSMAYNLMPPSLEKFGLQETLDEFCVKLNKHNPSMRFTFGHEGNALTLDGRQQLFLYRIAQEAANNAIRHAEASEIKITMNWEPKALLLMIADNGKGFDFPDENNKIHGRHGLGLFSLENRAALLGAELKFSRNNPSGTLLKVELPLNA